MSTEEATNWPKKRHVPSSVDGNDVSDDVTQVVKKIPDDDFAENNGPGQTLPVKDYDGSGDSNPTTSHSGMSNSGLCGRCYIPRRYIITFMLGMGMLLIYSMRTNVGVTVVMILDEAPHEKVGTLDAMFNLPRVGWGSKMVGFLHSVFYIGFITTQLPAAYFTTFWPSHRLFGLCILVSALLNLLLPVCIQHGQYTLTCVVRACQGLAEGLLYPACYGVLRHWSAPTERSITVSVVLTSGYAGAIMGFPVGGLITHYVGWQYVYYFCGGLCLVWYVLWACFAFEKPSHHTSISDSEYEFMKKTQGQDVIDYENAKVPWKNILTSLPVIAICFCHFARHWLFILMLTNEPLYLNEFGFTIAQTGFYASLPHMAKVVFSFGSGIIADVLLNSSSMSTTGVRKLLTGIGYIGPSLCFLALTFLSDGIIVIIVLTIALGTFGLSTSGWSVNHYDLSTRHASSLVAVSSTFGTIGAILVPLVVGALTVNQDLDGWNDVFYTTVAVLVFAGLFYLIFGSGEQQPWANPDPELNLVQKVDPLARKPYKLQTLTKQSSDTSNNATDQTSLVTSKYGHGYGTDIPNKQMDNAT